MSIMTKKYTTNNLDKPNIPLEILDPKQMSMVDRLAVTLTGEDSFNLMERAGQAVADIVIKDYRSCQKIAVLCGSGNNGGDGYVAAHILKAHGFDVTCFALANPRENSDAKKAFTIWGGFYSSIDLFEPDKFCLIIDALYGAGLDRPLDAQLQALIAKICESNRPVVAIDLPSGVFGRTGAIAGKAVEATQTVTFFRLKPGHVCYPGRAHCGKIVLVDIGIPDSVLDTIKPLVSLNARHLWQKDWPILEYDTHKYRRGHAVVFSGSQTATGAARLAAFAAARSGAGLVSVVAPEDALPVHEMHLTSIMLKKMADDREILLFLLERKAHSVVLGPAFGNLERAFSIAKAILREATITTLVLDADALTALSSRSEEIFKLIKASSVNVILTPHEGEFRRVFPDIAEKEDATRIEKAEQAAKRSGATLIYKGADTMVAAPSGRIAIAINGTPYLATAGAGDVLSGIVGGLGAQQMPPFEAACAAVWIHAECARHYGPGLIAEDIVSVIPTVLREFFM